MEFNKQKQVNIMQKLDSKLEAFEATAGAKIFHRDAR